MYFLSTLFILLCVPILSSSQEDYVAKGYITKGGKTYSIFNRRYINGNIVYERKPITLLSSITDNPMDYRISKYKYLNNKLVSISSKEETVNSFTTIKYNEIGNKREVFTTNINKYAENNDDITANRTIYIYSRDNNLLNIHEYKIYGNGDTCPSKTEYYIYDSINKLKNIITLRFHCISEKIIKKYYSKEAFNSFNVIDTYYKYITHYDNGYKMLEVQSDSTTSNLGLIENRNSIEDENYINLDSFKSINLNEYLLIHKEHKLFYSNYIEKYHYDELNRIKTIHYIYKGADDTIRGEVTFKYFHHR